MSTTYSSCEGCYALELESPSSGYSSKSEYIGDYSGTPTGYDIGFQQTDSAGDIWMATDNATSPVSCYQAATGTIVCSLEASIGIGSDIRVIAFEESSNNYLWVSNPTTDKLYRVELLVGIDDSRSPESEFRGISIDRNPFFSVLNMSLTGFEGSVTLEIYNLQGRKIYSAMAENSYSWDNSTIPSGIFFIRVFDETGWVVTESVVKL